MSIRRPYHNISSTTLFNFTDTFDRLIGNLKGIYCGDVYEPLPQFGVPVGYIVPMVCFCDIPLGLIKEHLDWYGNYAIGIRRDYARTLNICPVWYIHKENPVLLKMFHSTKKEDLAKSPILPYLKRFLGKQMYLPEGVKKEKKFYDEKEWRFIPNEEKYQAKFTQMTHIEAEALAKSPNKKRETKMPIDAKAIEYIIVKNDTDKQQIYGILSKLAEESNVRYEDLISSIITSTQIHKDF